jgi:hypothetical protein
MKVVRYIDFNAEGKLCIYKTKAGKSTAKEIPLINVKSFVESMTQSKERAFVSSWTDKTKPFRVRIQIPKGTAMRDVYFYANNKLEAEITRH